MAAISGWIGNKADSPTTIEITNALADEFLESSFYDPEAPFVSRDMMNWLIDRNGKNLAWDPKDPANGEAFGELCDRVRDMAAAS